MELPPPLPDRDPAGRRSHKGEPPIGWLVAEVSAASAALMVSARGGGGWIVLHFDRQTHGWIYAAGAYAQRWYAVRKARALEAARAILY